MLFIGEGHLRAGSYDAPDGSDTLVTVHLGPELEPADAIRRAVTPADKVGTFEHAGTAARFAIAPSRIGRDPLGAGGAFPGPEDDQPGWAKQPGYPVRSTAQLTF